MAHYRILIHIDEYGKADLVLTNARNALLDMGEAEVEVVVNYEAVLMLIQRPNHRAGAIRELMQKGVRFVACSNAMRAFGVGGEMLIEGVEICPAAMGEIVRRQAEGFFYIRP
ncbi:MAG: DsrE family protein [Methanomicrobiales archaeon]|nr:DsrE family protein [Methanomicrobiales archaeon]MDI6876777.1 DsrE family protein [Methanomicrobiales archaeon]